MSTDERSTSTKGNRIAYAIEAVGHNPASIAKLLAVKPAAVYQWIDGSTQNLKEDHLWKLADITGFEARWISRGEGPMQRDRAVEHARSVLYAMEPAVRYKAVRLLDTFAEPNRGNGTQ